MCCNSVNSGQKVLAFSSNLVFPYFELLALSCDCRDNYIFILISNCEGNMFYVNIAPHNEFVQAILSTIILNLDKSYHIVHTQLLETFLLPTMFVAWSKLYHSVCDVLWFYDYKCMCIRINLY